MSRWRNRFARRSWRKPSATGRLRGRSNIGWGIWPSVTVQWPLPAPATIATKRLPRAAMRSKSSSAACRSGSGRGSRMGVWNGLGLRHWTIGRRQHPVSSQRSAGPPVRLSDRLDRPLGSLRLSVTDRCNMRCGYCMPEENYVWLPRESLLRFEELDRVAGCFLRLGAGKGRLTGGEPLLRHGLATLIAMLAAHGELSDLALTTNGILLAAQAEALRAAGLQRVTVSLDTLRPERMLAFARSARHADVLEGILAAQAAGFARIKLNSVIIRGFNDDEVVPLLEFARAHALELRFIEYMDVGGATRWCREDVVSRAELLELIAERFGAVEGLSDPVRPNAPAERFALPDG